ncbi:MAG: DUF4349 domain-containing protein [Firmicutes bacterium]|nr:DUF4349 domain-containing protein [Bacillota bacterium]
MRCEELRELLSAYLDGELNPEEAAAVESHLDTCPACAPEFADLRRTVELCHAVGEVDMPENFHSELMRKIEAKQARSGILHRLGVDRWKPAYRTAAAVAAVVVVSVGISSVVEMAQRPGGLYGTKAGQTRSTRENEQARGGGAVTGTPAADKTDMAYSQSMPAETPVPAPAAPPGMGGGAEGFADSTKRLAKAPAGQLGVSMPPIAPDQSYDIVVEDLDRKLVKRADLQVEIEKGKVDETGRKIIALVETSKGFIQRSGTFTDELKYRGMNFVLRVPEDRFATILGELESYGKIMSKNINSEDVTQQFIDTQAQIKNKERQEQRLVEIMGKANSVGELMQVENELNRVRSEVDMLKGRMKYLQSATSYSTITMTIREAREGSAAIPGTPGLLDEVWQAFMSTFRKLAITLAKAAPYAILIGVGWIIYNKVTTSKGKSAA